MNQANATDWDPWTRWASVKSRTGLAHGKARQGVGSLGRRVQDIALALTECEKLTLRKSTTFDRYQYIASCRTLQSRTQARSRKTDS